MKGQYSPPDPDKVAFMFSPLTSDLFPEFERAIPSKSSDAPARTGRNLLTSKFDEKFQDMRAEHARTMALMRALRTSPLYRNASFDSQHGGEAEHWR
jgi:hypothetical protein